MPQRKATKTVQNHFASVQIISSQNPVEGCQLYECEELLEGLKFSSGREDIAFSMSA